MEQCYTCHEIVLNSAAETLAVKILLALDKFKGSFSADEVSTLLSAGIRETAPKAKIIIKPVYDGGEGTADSIAQLFSMDTRTVHTENVAGQNVNANIHWLGNRRLAIIESAQVLRSELPWSREDFLRSGSWALGRLIVRALELRPKELWITSGGTLTSDGGWGTACCFGIDALDSSGAVLEPRVSNLDRIRQVFIRHHHEVFGRTEVTLLCDVNAPMFAPGGVTLRSFLRQKGATKDDEAKVTQGLERFRNALQSAQLVTLPAGAPYSGAAGGIALGLGAVNSRLQCQSGAQTYMRLAAVRAAMNDADLVVCGEGKIDETTLYGKSPYAVAMLANELHVPAVGVFGEQADPEHLQALNLRQAYIVTEIPSQVTSPTGDQSRREWMKNRRNKIVAIGRLIGSYARGVSGMESESA